MYNFYHSCYIRHGYIVLCTGRIEGNSSSSKPSLTEHTAIKKPVVQ